MNLFQNDQEVTVLLPETKQLAMGTIVDSTLGENKLLIKVKGKKMTVDQDDVIQVDGFPRKKPVYFQPRLTDEEMAEADFNSFDVYRHFENAKEDFPDSVIDRYEGSDIEDHQYVDDNDGRSTNYYVDVPNPDVDGDDFKNVYQCFDRDEAILYARLNWGADENGMISIISQS